MSNWPIWLSYLLSIAVSFLAGVIGYISFKATDGDAVDIYVIGFFAAVLGFCITTVSFYKELKSAADTLRTARLQNWQNEEIIRSASHLIREQSRVIELQKESFMHITGGDGIPKIEIRILKESYIDRYRAVVYICNDSRYPIYDVNITISDPGNYATNGFVDSIEELEEFNNADAKGFDTVLSPFALPPRTSSLFCRFSLMFNCQEIRKYTFQILWRNGIYTISVDMGVENFYPIVTVGLFNEKSRSNSLTYLGDYFSRQIRLGANIKEAALEKFCGYFDLRANYGKMDDTLFGMLEGELCATPISFSELDIAPINLWIVYGFVDVSWVCPEQTS